MADFGLARGTDTVLSLALADSFESLDGGSLADRNREGLALGKIGIASSSSNNNHNNNISGHKRNRIEGDSNGVSYTNNVGYLLTMYKKMLLSSFFSYLYCLHAHSHR